MSILTQILKQALRRPRATAVIDDQRSFTYSQLVGAGFFLAAQIEQSTDKPHVGLLLPTGGGFAASLLGCWLAKRIAVPLNYLLSPDELAYVINDSEVDVILTAAPMIEALKLGPVIPKHVQLIPIETLDFSGLPPLRWPPRLADDSLAAILYTSGTSGRPKGVMLTHRNFQSDVAAAIEHARIRSVDTFLGVLPQFHCFGLTGLTLLPLAVGARVIYTARFIPRQIVRLLRRHQPDIFMAVPSMYAALLSVKDASADDFKSLRFAISGAEPLPQTVFDSYQQRFGLQLMEGYGLTETAPVTNWATPWDFAQHSVGKALPGVTVAVIDEQNRYLPAEQNGEIIMAGPNIMAGYFKLPDETRETFVDLPDPDSGESRRFFRSGDIGRLDEQGRLFITGRKKEMLIIGGENVFPREIEEALNQHPQIHACAVIGVADDLRGETPIAFVELAQGVTREQFDPQAVRNWARNMLAPFKVPREVRVTDELPRNPTGKILRRKLTA